MFIPVDPLSTSLQATHLELILITHFFNFTLRFGQANWRVDVHSRRPAFHFVTSYTLGANSDNSFF